MFAGIDTSVDAARRGRAPRSSCSASTMFAMGRQLKDLRGIGKKMLQDFDRLGVRSVAELKSQDAQELYARMCELTGTRQDPCVLDTYRCAIEQARNPDLPPEQRDWWYWSRLRKSGR